MNYERKIIEFTEGLLGKDEEINLLNEMAINENLRMQFKSILSFESETRNAAKSFTPSIDLRKSVFAGAGFADMSNISKPISSISKSAGSNFSRFASVAAASVLSSFITILFFVNFNESENKADNLFADKVKSEQNITVPNLLEPIHEANIKLQNSKPILNEKIAQNISTVVKTPQIIEINNSKEISIVPILSYSDKTNNLNEKSNYKSIAADITENEFLEILKNFSIEFSGIDNLFFNEQNVFSANIPPFINKNVSINYNINDYLYTGISFRNENFYIKYQSIDKENKKFNFEQQPSLNSYNLHIGIKKNIINLAVPFAKISIGATNIGPVVRAESGLGILLSKNIEIFGSAGLDRIFYKHQNNPFNSSKWSINYGLKYNF